MWRKKMNEWLEWADRLAYKYFILIVGFTSIIVLVSILGKDNVFHINLSGGARYGISIATMLLALSICYLQIRNSFRKE